VQKFKYLTRGGPKTAPMFWEKSPEYLPIFHRKKKGNVISKINQYEDANDEQAEV
jgi:hypothetical protein